MEKLFTKERIELIKEGFKDAIKAIKEGLKNLYNDLKKLWREDKDFLIFLSGVFLGTWKFFSNSKRRNYDRDRYELKVWDNRTGIHHRLRRPLTVYEQIELDRRRAQGESVAEILQSMGVLRKW